MRNFQLFRQLVLWRRVSRAIARTAHTDVLQLALDSKKYGTQKALITGNRPRPAQHGSGSDVSGKMSMHDYARDRSGSGNKQKEPTAAWKPKTQANCQSGCSSRMAR